MASDLPRSRVQRRASAISLGATRTTRSPRRNRKRSSAPETWRQSSIAHTRSAPRPRPQPSRSSNDRRAALTVRSASTRPVAASTAPAVCERLCVSAPITIICTVPSLNHERTDRRWTHLSRGGATLLSGHAGILGRRRATRHPSVRRAVDRKSIGQPVAGPRTYRSRRTPPPDPGTLSLRKSSPQRPCLPVGGEVRVAGFGEACALQVVRIGVGAGRAVSSAWWGAGLELEPAEFAGDEQRSLVV